MMDSELVPVGTDAEGRGLFTQPGLVTYKGRGLSRDMCDTWAALRDAVTAGGAMLEVVYRGRSRSAVPFPYFSAHLIFWDGRSVQLRGVTQLLIASGFVNRSRGSEWFAAYRGGETLARGVAGLLVHVLGLEVDGGALPFAVVEL